MSDRQFDLYDRLSVCNGSVCCIRYACKYGHTCGLKKECSNTCSAFSHFASGALSSVALVPRALMLAIVHLSSSPGLTTTNLKKLVPFGAATKFCRRCYRSAAVCNLCNRCLLYSSVGLNLNCRACPATHATALQIYTEHGRHSDQTLACR